MKTKQKQKEIDGADEQRRDAVLEETSDFAEAGGMLAKTVKEQFQVRFGQTLRWNRRL